jgi:hypothetical protein
MTHEFIPLKVGKAHPIHPITNAGDIGAAKKAGIAGRLRPTQSWSVTQLGWTFAPRRCGNFTDPSTLEPRRRETESSADRAMGIPSVLHLFFPARFGHSSSGTSSRMDALWARIGR